VQLALRTMRADHIPPRPVGFSVIAQDLAASTGDQPLNSGGKRIRNRDFDEIDRLEQNRLAFRQRFLDRLAPRRLEGLVRAVDGMELAGDQMTARSMTGNPIGPRASAS